MSRATNTDTTMINNWWPMGHFQFIGRVFFFAGQSGSHYKTKIYIQYIYIIYLFITFEDKRQSSCKEGEKMYRPHQFCKMKKIKTLNSVGEF